MQTGKFNILLDAFWGSSGKGKMATWLADKFEVSRVSSSNFPNAGHSAVFDDGTKFVSKAIPTASVIQKVRNRKMQCYISPGSGFNWERLISEWEETGKPRIWIHGRASLVNEGHAARERAGSDSTKHIASTMQGSGAAISDKIMRRPDCTLAQSDEVSLFSLLRGKEYADMIQVIDPEAFRRMTWEALEAGHTWLHEGSQGFALSIDHGSHYPYCTSRNCTVQAAMDHMAVPPALVGDVYLNLRTFPIRVGNVYEDGKEVGFSGGFYSDCKEMTWEQVAKESGMPEKEAKILAERERTTVTKRVRRVCTFTFEGLEQAVKVNGATKLALNFVQYLDWKDHGIRGERDAFNKLSSKTRELISSIEEETNVPVVLIGTGANHEDVISLL